MRDFIVFRSTSYENDADYIKNYIQELTEKRRENLKNIEQINEQIEIIGRHEEDGDLEILRQELRRLEQKVNSIQGIINVYGQQLEKLNEDLSPVPTGS